MSSSIFANTFWLVISIFLGIICIIKFRRFFLIGMLISGFLIGAYRMSVFNQDKDNFKHFYGQKIILTGTITDDINYGPDSELRVKLNHIQIDSKDYKGEIWLSSREDVSLKRSDKVVVGGQLKSGFGGFSASMTNADIIEVQKTSTRDSGLIIRDNFADATDKIDQPGRSLGLGFLLGQKTNLPEDLQKKCKKSGTFAHDSC